MSLIGEDIFGVSKIETEKMKDWLYESYANDGYKQYFTLRKKAIQNELTIGLKGEEYWKKIGRIEELRALNSNINKEVERRKKEDKQHN